MAAGDCKSDARPGAPASSLLCSFPLDPPDGSVQLLSSCCAVYSAYSGSTWVDDKDTSGGCGDSCCCPINFFEAKAGWQGLRIMYSIINLNPQPPKQSPGASHRRLLRLCDLLCISGLNPFSSVLRTKLRDAFLTAMRCKFDYTSVTEKQT